ncbi:uncharacterized protein LOC123555153 [Mercenaria mercenaria]|uniref:uncharacterized protein LOC123555153 n=1 Tax=Mercenaria mercenaria TaxID=6596 RepID=UPI00234F6C85|nr:uncharacterized protein LOC123555153 [Mercenaria mercenaria]
MRLTLLAGTALLLGTCVYSQPQPPCRTTLDVCRVDSDCGDGGKCNTVSSKCCEQLPPMQCKITPDQVCQKDSDCREVWGNMGKCDTKSERCCDLSADGSEADLPALNASCPGLKPDTPWNCTGLTACPTSNQGTCGPDKHCCLAGKCGEKCLPDLSICVDTSRILQTVIANFDTCLVKIQDVLTATTFDKYCGSLLGGLQCVSEKLTQGFTDPIYSSLCFRRMMRYMAKSPQVIFDEIEKYMKAFGQPFNINQTFVSNSGKCPVPGGDDDDDDSKDKDDDEDEDKDWNSSCPKMDDEGGLCPATECTTDSECGTDKPKCCSLGREECRTCMPDFKQCGSIELVIASPKVAACLPKLLQLGQIRNYNQYCSVIWDAFDCLAENIMPDAANKDLCLKRMAVYVQQSPFEIIKTIISALQGMSQGVSGVEMLSRYARGTAECKESPLYEAPERPVPDDVKVCFNKERIMGAAGQCGRITGSSRATNEACGNLKTLIECIAGKLVPGRDANAVRKCAGEIYEFVEKNRERLSNVFGNLNPESCEERTSVCGGDMKPLDINCTLAGCPANYVCKDGYCCPQEKQGWCPKQEPGERSICKRECKMDSQCEANEKCCKSMSCGYKTCMKMETEMDHDKSKCEKEFEDGKRQLQNQGICGDGTTLTKLPRCQNERFSPMQVITETLRGYCVNENGTKINGSDFIGNRDCTKVRQGRCPTPPAACKSVGKDADTCHSDDFRCGDDEKCCIALEGNTCLTKCIKAQKAPETVVDDCADRKCCPVTTCDNKICLKDRTARCRINSCGKCEAEFYNLKGENVNCSEDVSLCQRQRAEAREENARRRKSEFDSISSFVMSRDRRERESREGPDSDEDDDNEMEKDMRRDEYGMSRQGLDDLPEDSEDEMGDMRERMTSVSLRLCAVFDKFNVCKNGGECKIGSGESFWEICNCASGYSGLFCENSGSVKPLDTQCYRDHQRIKTMSGIMMTTDNMKERMLLQEMFNKVKPPQKIMSLFACDPATGSYKEIQMGMILPNTINSIKIYYCADTNTGLRKEGTPVTLAQSERMPNCAVTTAIPDIMGLPKKCMSMNMSICTATDECQYFLNQETGMCEKGKAGGGFRKLTDCYDQCTIQKGCINDPTGSMENSEDFVCEKGIISGPKPCRMTDENNEEYDTCDYNRQFCEVVETETGHNGTCTAFPSYCLESPDSGFGSREIGAYYFNAMTRRCEKFRYKGSTGNGNRFYSLHQCHTECGPRPYKFDDVVCPVPKLLAMSMESPNDMCDEDNDCHGTDVCCSTGKAKVCTSYTRTCFTSMRCSLHGSCLEGKCVCDDCSNAVKSEVCGSDGMTYPSVCHLKKKSCEMMQNVTVAFNGSCKTKCGDSYCASYEMCNNNVCKCPEFCTEQYEPVCGKSSKSGAYCLFSNECKMTVHSCQMKERFVKIKDELCSPNDSPGTCMLQCTREYNPVCAYDTTEDVPKLVTYANPCRLREALLNGKKIKVLYPGQCAQKCGDTECEHYQVCYNNTCTCQEGCTKEYRPICAHPLSNDAKLITFSNLCLMKQQSCKEEKTYMIVKHGACKEPEPVYECPKTRPDIPFSATVECKKENNAGCDTGMGEMCCPYGAGMKCLPKKALVRRKTMKDGICPNFYGNNFDSTNCKSSMCMSDDDCDGDSKCCENDVCGNMTCAAPLVRDDESPCGANAKMVSQCAPKMDETGCPEVGTCTSVVTAENENVGICCVPNEQLMKGDIEKELMQSKFCKLMSMIGITCENNGTCIGDIRGGEVCQCRTGYFGPFCRNTLPPDDCGVTVEVQCAANPCDVTKCPGVPEATCEANYCGGCNALFKNGSDDVTHLCQATPCLVQRATMTRLVKAVSDSPMENEGDMNTRRKRRETHMEDKDDMDEDTNPFSKMLMYLMKHMGMHSAPECTAEGSFKLEQCSRDMMSNSTYCYCVDGHTGTPIPNGPKLSNLGMLNCSDLSANNMGLQEFCWKEMPSKKVCGETMTYRFFYNPATMDCEIFSDYGCNVDAKNNFVNYETCKSACGVRNNVLSKCATVRCGNGQRCFIKDGNAVCMDPDNIDTKFEPICDADGKFSPKQCNGEMCKCVNRATGATVDNSEADGAHLKCERDGEAVKAIRTQTKRCTGNKPAKFCDDGAGICNNCEGNANQGNGRGDDRKVDENNVCTSCQSCPAGQGKQKCPTEKLCIDKCKQFPSAVCRINKCTCKEEYIANDRVVNCSAVQSQCEKERHNIKLEEWSERVKNNGKLPENVKQLKCSESGAYYAECMGNQCYCVNATDGRRVGNAQTGRNVNNIECGSVQRKTILQRLNMLIRFLNKLWSEMTTGQQKQFNRTFVTKIESRGSLKVSKVKYSDGSIIADVEIEKCNAAECGADSGTSELSSIAADIQAEANSGELVIEVDGESIVASSGTITSGVTAEELEGPATEKTPDDDDNTTTIIIVVVVVVVVVILAVGIACYCYNKANKSKNKDIPFSDLQGNSNPAYGKA